ncbi:MAG: TlpA family protein disulfide reductase [Acidimicrobiales bacterium]
MSVGGTAAVGPAPTGAAGAIRRRRHTARWAAAAVLAVLVVVAVVAATRPSYQATQVASPLLGRAAPPVAGTDFAGRPFSLSAERGHYVYVNFFASWCPPCQAEEQDLVAFDFQQQRARRGVGLVSVVFNDSVADARRFVANWGAQWPTVPDRAGSIATSYGVSSPPMTFLVDPRGRVVAAFTGPVTTGQLDQALATARQRGY